MRDVAANYRDDYLHAIRVKGQDAQREAARDAVKLAEFEQARRDTEIARLDREIDAIRERETKLLESSAREQFERAYLHQQLMLCNGKVGLLAKRVGMERTHLYRKLRSLGVDFRHITED